MAKNFSLFVLVLGLALGACGSSKSSSTADAGGGGGSSGKAGSAGGTSGTGGSGGSTSTGTAKDGGIKFDAGAISATCDNKVKSVATCGSNACTAVSAQLAQFCFVTCCTPDNKCGQKNTSSQASTVDGGAALATCTPAPAADPRCPGAQVTLPTLGQMDATGCCATGNKCGLNIFGQCAARAQLNQLGGTSLPILSCGGDAGTGNDAGH